MMKATTLYQPWAYAAVAGLKGNETRPRRTHIRGRVAIHAGKRDAWKNMIAPEDLAKIEAILSESQGLPPEIPAKLDYGAVIGTVEIVDCKPVEEVLPTLTEQERLLGNYSPGRFVWVLKDPVMFEKPIPAKGKQGWWNWDNRTCGECEYAYLKGGNCEHPDGPETAITEQEIACVLYEAANSNEGSGTHGNAVDKSD